MDSNLVFQFSTGVATALRPASLFSLEGGRLAAIQGPTGGELCPKQGPNSASQSTFGFKGRSMATGVSVAQPRAYTFRTGSNAPGGTG